MNFLVSAQDPRIVPHKRFGEHDIKFVELTFALSVIDELRQMRGQDIQEATERLNRLVDNLLDMTRLESDKLKLNPRMTTRVNRAIEVRSLKFIMSLSVRFLEGLPKRESRGSPGRTFTTSKNCRNQPFAELGLSLQQFYKQGNACRTSITISDCILIT